jgi:hypothetical protein
VAKRHAIDLAAASRSDADTRSTVTEQNRSHA